MPRYIARIRTPKAPAEAFAYMADLNNFAEWDPGVKSVVQVEGSEPAVDSAYDVEVNGIAGTITLTYHITSFDEPNSLVAKAQSSMLTSVDEVTVVPDGSGAIVTYDAELTLNGILGLANPLLGLVFNQIGDKAAGGMVEALDGEHLKNEKAAQ